MSPNINQLDTNPQLSKRFLFLKKKLTHFWTRWKKEYLVNLRECHRMKRNTPNAIIKGEVVLVHEDGAKRFAWKMGIIKDLITGKDGEVRGVSVQVIGKGKPFISKRPIQKVYPLEVYNTLGSDLESGTNVNVENVKSGKDEKGVVGKEEKTSEGEVRGGNPRPMRAAAKDARCKTKLLLDP